MAFTSQTPMLGFPPIAATLAATAAITQGATSVYPAAAGGRRPGARLGQIIQATDPTYGNGEFIYLKGLDATVVGSWVTINPDDFTTTLLAANAIGAVGIAMSINLTGFFGWYQISGKAVGKALAAYADNGLVYATATAGSVDDAVVAGDRVKNAIGASAVDTPSTGLAEFEINRPFMDDATAA